LRSRVVRMVAPRKVVLDEEDVPEPGDEEVLVRVKACGICRSDLHTYEGVRPVRLPAVLGHEAAGTVAAVGDGVDELKPGDKVTVLGGRFGEYVVVPRTRVEKIPGDVEDYACWISEPITCAVNGLKASGIQPGDKVCVVGCGYMGLLLIQGMPRRWIETLVALDINEMKLRLAEKYGADYALNPRRTGIKEMLEHLGGHADVVIEAAGVPGTIEMATRLVKKRGTLVIFGFHARPEETPTDEWHVKGLRILNPSPPYSPDILEDFRDAVRLMRRGVFHQEELITHRFHYTEAQEALETALKRPKDYIKGVMTF